jgi:gamma-glutamyltranspeptidase/glutathione hydrolase
VALALCVQAQKLTPELVGWGEAHKGVMRAPERGRHGMVASADEVASRAGVEIMKQGGNAVDAAVAVAFALAVTFPEAGNVGGGGFALVYMADGRTTAIDYREQAPMAARAGMFTEEGERWFGYRSLAVPGTVAGMGWMHERYGAKSWSAVLEPARRLAQEGCPVSFRTEATLKLVSARLRQFQDVARIFMPSGRLPEQGDVLRQPELARTIATLQKRGWREFYEGELGRRMVADIREHGGIITQEDWNSYRPGILEPARGSYRGYPILTMPPSSWGGIGLLEMLNILEQFPLQKESQGSCVSWHLMIETMRRAYYDRDRWYRMPGLEPAEAATLVSKQYAAEAAKRIRTDRATPSAELGVVVTKPERALEQTTHFTVVDGQGNIVSNGYTLQGALGATVAPKGTGVLLSGGLGYFSANCHCENDIGPGKRAIYSMTPTLVLDQQGKPWFALGTPGDFTIPAQLFQVMINLIDFQIPLREAVDASRIYHRYLPDRVAVEPGAFSPDTAEKLRALGHRIDVRTRPLGDVHAVMIDPASGWRLGWSDGRAGGRAAGF